MSPRINIRTQEFSDGINYEQFVADRKTIDTVVKNFLSWKVIENAYRHPK
jgi:hypothetical protein